MVVYKKVGVIVQFLFKRGNVAKAYKRKWHICESGQPLAELPSKSWLEFYDFKERNAVVVFGCLMLCEKFWRE